MPWVTPDAPTAAELAACVQCGLCLPHCPTFRLTGRETASPRGRLIAMSAVASGVSDVDEVFEELMSFCLQCRACEAVCPSLAPFGRAMEGARAELTAQRPGFARRLRHLAVGRLLASSRLLRMATGATALAQRFGLLRLAPTRLRGGAAGLRPLAARPPRWAGDVYEPIAPRVGTAALLAGCVMAPWFSEVHRATVEVLRRAGYEVVVTPGQTCCGALAAHEGAAAAARRMARRNVEAFASADLIVVDAAGCGAHMKDYVHWAGDAGAVLASKVRDVTEVVADSLRDGLLPALDASRGPAAVQDPCHLRHAQRITVPPREVVRAAGYEVVEIDEDGLCCGAAGIYSLLRPEASGELGRRKAGQVRAAGSTVVASANPGCELQLRSHLDGWYRVAHPVELYWESLAEHQAAAPAL